MLRLVAVQHILKYPEGSPDILQLLKIAFVEAWMGMGWDNKSQRLQYFQRRFSGHSLGLFVRCSAGFITFLYSACPSRGYRIFNDPGLDAPFSSAFHRL